MLTDAIKNTRILVINVCNPLSHGGAAITISLLKLLKTAIPYSVVTLMVTRESDAEVYKERYRIKNVNFIKHTWYRPRESVFASILHTSLTATWAFFRCLTYYLPRNFGIKINNIYGEYDIVLDLNSDSLNEYYGVTFPLFTLFQLMLVLLCGKPVIVCPSSIGPFKNGLLKQFASFVLSKMHLIIVRDETSRDYLHNMGLSSAKVQFTADLAFLLEPITTKEAKALLETEEIEIDKGNKLLIGVAPSQEIYRYFSSKTKDKYIDKYRKYVKLMAEISDFIIERFDATVIFIPHFDTPEFSKNDRIVCRKIYQEVKNKHRAKLIQGNYRADEIKGIIKLCDMFIGCRMHSAIASMSSGVPTLVLAYGHKFHGILGKMMGQEACIVNADSDFESVLSLLKQKVEYIWENKNSIKDELQERAKLAKARARTNVLLIKKALEREIRPSC
jgi:polysaccharide pyruvyl transferase WcaK-like protein